MRIDVTRKRRAATSTRITITLDLTRAEMKALEECDNMTEADGDLITYFEDAIKFFLTNDLEGGRP